LPEPRLPEVMLSVLELELTFNDSCVLAVCWGDPLSATVTVKVDVPLDVGVPEMTPALESVRPAGRLPDETLHV
jgi:hypothetical protein